MKPTAKPKQIFFLPIIFLILCLLVPVLRMEAVATSEPLRYLSDPNSDSTRSDIAPWGEIIEIWIEGDAITIKSREIMYSGGGYFLLFFDENFDNITDIIFRYTKVWSVLEGAYIEKAHLCRPSNHSYYHHGAWNYTQSTFDPKTEENATLGQMTFHLGEALRGELRLKVVSHYYFYTSLMRRSTGGDIVPNCPWKVEEITLSPTYIEETAKIVNDTRFLYPNETFLLQEPEPPPPPPPPTVIELIFSTFSSIQSWITSNMATTTLLSIFSMAAIYSLASRIRVYIKVFFVCFIITALIYSSTLQSSLFAAMSISIALLVPLFLWYRGIAESLSSILNVQKRFVWVEVLTLFSVALALRLLFSIFSLQLPFGNIPLVYLVVLIIVLIKANTLDTYGFKMKSFAKSLLIGLVYYFAYGFPFFATIFSLVFIFTGQLAFSSYNVLATLIYFPFMTICVSISEEGLFRGFVQTRLARVYNKSIALLAQALLFGAWQVVIFVSPTNVMGMTIYILQTIAWGLISGLFYKTSENLIPLIFTNGLVNTFLLVTNPIEIYKADPFFSIILGVSISAGLIVQVIFTKDLAKRARVKKEMNTQGVE